MQLYEIQLPQNVFVGDLLQSESVRGQVHYLVSARSEEDAQKFSWDFIGEKMSLEPTNSEFNIALHPIPFRKNDNYYALPHYVARMAAYLGSVEVLVYAEKWHDKRRLDTLNDPDLMPDIVYVVAQEGDKMRVVVVHTLNWEIDDPEFDAHRKTSNLTRGIKILRVFDHVKAAFP